MVDIFNIIFQYIIRCKMASIECFSMLSLVLCLTSNSVRSNKVNIGVNGIDDITIMLTWAKLHSGYNYSQEHKLNMTIARLGFALEYIHVYSSFFIISAFYTVYVSPPKQKRDIYIAFPVSAAAVA